MCKNPSIPYEENFNIFVGIVFTIFNLVNYFLINNYANYITFWTTLLKALSKLTREFLKARAHTHIYKCVRVHTHTHIYSKA